MDVGDTLLEKVQQIQDGLISKATGGDFPGGEDVYRLLRQELLDNPQTAPHMPPFVKRVRNMTQFWSWIQPQSPQYQGRRVILWNAFEPLLNRLEAQERSPGSEVVTATLEKFDGDHVRTAWQKAIDRRANDPDGAITAARTLLESVCKHVLEDLTVDGVPPYAKNDDLPKLWRLAAEKLNLAPDQHSEQAFKTILGNVQAVVQGLATIRNTLGDAHGMGRKPVKPSPRHAELCVNLAGTMASFIISTWEARSN